MEIEKVFLTTQLYKKSNTLNMRFFEILNKKLSNQIFKLIFTNFVIVINQILNNIADSCCLNRFNFLSNSVFSTTRLSCGVPQGTTEAVLVMARLVSVHLLADKTGLREASSEGTKGRKRRRRH